jgi:hypothetical protein
MASLVNPSNINGNFPIAGQDNDSQGFRDNFTNIRNNFAFIKGEVEDLQNKAILKTALTGSTLDNNFQGSQLKNVQFKDYSETVNDWGNTAGEIQLDYALGNVHKVYTVDSVTINAVIKNPPGTLQFSRLLLYITISNTSHTLTIPNTIATELSGIAGLRKISGVDVINFTETGTYVFEFATVDQGVNFFVRDLSRANQLFRDPNFYFNNIGAGAASSSHPSGFESPTLKLGWGNLLSISTPTVSIPDIIDTKKLGADVLQVRGGITSYYSHADGVAIVTNPNDPSKLATAGFSVSSSRIATPAAGSSSVLGATGQLNSGDLVGYFNALGYVNDANGGATTSFNQMASIAVYSVGSDTNNGIGGNIVISTKKDGVAGLNAAMVIDNKQNVTVYGNLDVRGTQTTIESTVVSVNDLNFVVANGSASSTQANSAGLSVQLNQTGAYANIYYTSSGYSGIGSADTGGVWNFDKQVNVEVTTSSTDSRSGALVVKGGLGVAGALNVGGTFGLTSTTEATTTTSAAFAVGGGIAAAKNIIAGGALFANSTAVTYSVNSGSLVAQGGLGVAGIAIIGGNVLLTSTTDTTGTSTGALIVQGGLNVGKTLMANTGPVILGDTTDSTYTSLLGSAGVNTSYNGVMRVHGGAHIVKTLNVGNDAGAGKIIINAGASGGVGTRGTNTSGLLVVGSDAGLGGASITGVLNIGNSSGTQGGIWILNKNNTSVPTDNFVQNAPTPYSVPTGNGVFTSLGGANVLGNLFIGQASSDNGTTSPGGDAQWGSGNLYAISGAMSTGVNSGAIQIRKVKLPTNLASSNPGIYNDGFARGGMSMEGNLYVYGNVLLGGGGVDSGKTGYIAQTYSNVIINGLLDATNSNIASIVVKGGIGVNKTVQVEGNIVGFATTTGTAAKTGALVLSSGGAYINGTSVINGNLVLTSVDGGGTTTTGALVVTGSGGIGVGGPGAFGGQLSTASGTAGGDGAGALLVTNGGGSIAGNLWVKGAVQPINAVGAAGIALVSATGSDVTITQTAIVSGTISGMNFRAEAGKTYYFEAFIMHDMTTATGSKVFSVSYGPYGSTGAGTGTLTYTVEQSITTAATSLNVQGIQANASVSASASVASVPQNNLIARITGTFYASGVAQLVFVQCQSSAGSLVIRGSSFIKFTKLN